MVKPIWEVTTEEVANSLQKIITEPSSMAYMTTGLHQVIENAAIQAAGMHMAQMVAGGVEPKIAGHAASDMVLPLAFNLGIVVGRELQATDDFTRMMGGMFGGDAPSSDAGERE
jgi:hypothetical protein